MSSDLPTSSRISDPGIRALYQLESRWQAWLDVEVALAKAQAELGIIPAEAAPAIAAKAHLALMDRERINEGFARTAHTIVPLVWELSRIVGEPYGGWVHWGATTQNITQTGDLLVLRQAHKIVKGLISQILTGMADLAERGADMPMAGRTHGQHAVPATFGYKVAVWIDELIRHVERIEQMSPRLFMAMLGGAAGTFASLGEQGPAVQAGIAKYLGMEVMRVPSRAIGDHLAENICVLGLLAATCGKIGREIYTLMKTEFGEVEEPVPPGTVGSSTMPQKRNPKLCQDIIAAAADVRSMVPLALEAMYTEHEADRTTSLMFDSAEARACIATGELLIRLNDVVRGLRLNPARMRQNLDLGGGLIMAEAVMLDLGLAMGRQHAHDVVYEAAQTAFVEGKSFSNLLAADPQVTSHLDAAKIKTLLDPAAYTGLCSRMAHENAVRARDVAKRIAPHETAG
jgi:3-carboxy-cis,cis-muconate cycloisomerase